MDTETGRCIGCFRTGDEIMQWPSLSDAERLALLDDLKLRRRAAGRESAMDRKPRRRASARKTAQ